MLEGVLARLDEAGNLVPRFTAPRCLLERQAVGGCDACHATCPHGAISLGMVGQSVQIDPAKCTGCGLCVQVCPSGALEYNLEPALQSVKDQQAPDRRATPDASLTCSRSGAGGPSLPCLGRVTPALLSAAGAWGTPLTLLHGDCGECPVGAPDVPARLERVLDEAQRLREPTGQPAQVSIRAAQPEDAGRSLTVSRRGAFGALFRAGKQQVAQSIPDQPLPFIDWSVPEDRTPQEWVWRARSLKPAPPEDAAILWPAPLVDEKCIDCPVCANVCPTNAITRDLQPDGGVHLLLNLSACTGCMACLHSCPPQAIHAQSHWRPAAFRAPLLLRESDTVM
ncbi:4Fe-4S dicluster domain-containing protein [Deinococcus sp. HMF7620]|uniref:4Fe-4S dicluster domain-containing protein n=1 Tax=Deinococcus arboris TaxID=2682977 RepID=A0A7C9HSX3_9DEIO|nr:MULTISPECIES: 4Fe-4S dicluster domain-containing protein [Deinococcus]MBZ9753302.1 4Fe-4S binding protein [Deinococcus betulae]MVN88152.1 4Fe-4S dicluster domain-containing protein [Deinococcus arboris]